MGGIGLAVDGSRRILEGMYSAVKLSVPVAVMVVGPVVANGDTIKGAEAATLVVALPVTEGTPVPVPVASVAEFVADAPEAPVDSGKAVAVPLMVPVRSVSVIVPVAVAKPLAPVPVGVGPVASVEPLFEIGTTATDPEMESVGTVTPVVSVGAVTMPVMLGVEIGIVTIPVPVGVSVGVMIGIIPVPVSVGSVIGRLSVGSVIGRVPVGTVMGRVNVMLGVGREIISVADGTETGISSVAESVTTGTEMGSVTESVTTGTEIGSVTESVTTGIEIGKDVITGIEIGTESVTTGIEIGTESVTTGIEIGTESVTTGIEIGKDRESVGNDIGMGGSMPVPVGVSVGVDMG